MFVCRPARAASIAELPSLSQRERALSKTWRGLQLKVCNGDSDGACSGEETCYADDRCHFQEASCSGDPLGGISRYSRSP